MTANPSLNDAVRMAFDQVRGQSQGVQVAGGWTPPTFRLGDAVQVRDRGLSNPGGWAGIVIGAGDKPGTLRVQSEGSSSVRIVDQADVRPR